MSAGVINTEACINRLVSCLCDFVEVYGIDGSDESALSGARDYMNEHNMTVPERLLSVISSTPLHHSSSEFKTTPISVVLSQKMSYYVVPGEEELDIIKASMPSIEVEGWRSESEEFVDFKCLDGFDDFHRVLGTQIYGTVTVTLRLVRDIDAKYSMAGNSSPVPRTIIPVDSSWKVISVSEG